MVKRNMLKKLEKFSSTKMFIKQYCSYARKVEKINTTQKQLKIEKMKITVSSVGHLIVPTHIK